MKAVLENNNLSDVIIYITRGIEKTKKVKSFLFILSFYYGTEKQEIP